MAVEFRGQLSIDKLRKRFNIEFDLLLVFRQNIIEVGIEPMKNAEQSKNPRSGGIFIKRVRIGLLIGLFIGIVAGGLIGGRKSS